jgi:hypothetical protein
MRTINSNQNELFSSTDDDSIVAAVAAVMDTDRQPCWYVQVEKAEEQKDYSWKVGVKGNAHSEEHEFKFSEIGKSNDTETWNLASSPNFPFNILEKFKIGGKKAVKDWFKNGCP